AAKGRQADLRVDQPDGPEGAYRIEDGVQIIRPGDPDASEAWRRIISEDPDEVMPPPETKSHVKPLTTEERELLREWIVQGAKYEAFWSFVPPAEHQVPEVKKDDWSSRSIDRFTLATMEAKKLEPKPRADKRTLIRRLSLDLTGLPPTPEEIRNFLEDESIDAYSNLVERLLASPRHGEHMAKYWLDLVRFSDTNGIHHDHFRDHSPYRDWVIRSFNDNLPYDDFVKQQISGDLYPEPTTDQLIASGFNRLHLIIDVGTALPEESHFKNVVDRVSAVGTAFMGLTLQCAVCHDHKYDPISQKDFFQMYAFFNNFDGEPETGRRSGADFKRGLQPPYITLPTTDQEKQLDAQAVEIARLENEIETLTSRDEKDQPAIETAKAALKKVTEARNQLHGSLRGAMVMRERKEIRPAHIRVRGVYDNLGEEVTRITPSFLPPLEKEGLRTRMDLAEWLVAPENPLTARVAVNRIWQQFFGVGLVRTSEDFGAQGEWPSHPELLDHLTLQFVESGWDLRALVRDIVLSETYRQDSRAKPKEFANDPENRNLARGSRFRLDSEVIRDQLLAVSGLLNDEMFGPSIKYPQPEGLWKLVAMPSSYPREFKADTGDAIYRRSIYAFWKRGLPPPQMTIFDAPTREACIARRERTNTPLQALVMMNEQEYFGAAIHLAESLLKENSDDDARVRKLYERVTSKLPEESTVSMLQEALDDFRQTYTGDPEVAKTMLSGRENAAELAAWSMLVHSLFNLDETRNRE
ncbi:MAG: PSD1 and planctomycete cytochrome C domain-containing protein, partial [Verrucomicrobiota bacterium]